MAKPTQLEISCDCPQDPKLPAAFFALSGVLGAAATWIVSDATKLWVGGAIGAVSSLITLIVMNMFDEDVISQESGIGILAAVDMGSAMLVALAATAMGFSISIPLAFLLAMTTAASFVIVNFLYKE